MEKKQILLHTCCASCSPYVISVLQREFEPTIYYYNPNIHPFEEYLKRRLDLEAYVRSQGLSFIEGEYDDTHWRYLQRGLEHEPEGAERCYGCFRMRLNRTALYAATHGYEWFTTTLTVSPYKNSTLINKVGKELARNYGINYLDRDFKKNDGAKKSHELAKKLDFYRQKYCGCDFSLIESKERKRIKEESSHQATQVVSPNNA